MRPRGWLGAGWALADLHARAAYLYGMRFVGPITPLITELRSELYTTDYDSVEWCVRLIPRLMRCPISHTMLNETNTARPPARPAR